MSSNDKSEARTQRTWQDRLLPLMAGMVVGLTIFFLFASLFQLYYLNTRIQAIPTIPQASLERGFSCEGRCSPEMCVTLERMNKAAILEANITARRYHQASVLLMGRIWYTYLGFVTGMILALVGAAFILGQLQAPASRLEAKTTPVQVSFKSASPGLTLCVLGVALMIITFVNPQDVKVQDTTTYFGIEGKAGGTTPKPDIPSLSPGLPQETQR